MRGQDFLFSSTISNLGYENSTNLNSQIVPSPMEMVRTTDRQIIAVTTATIAAGKWALFSRMISLFSPINTAGTIIAVSTEIGIKSKAPLRFDGNLLGAIPDSITKRMAKVNNPVIIIMVQIIASPSFDSSSEATTQPEPHQLLRLKVRCSKVVLVQLEQAHLKLSKLISQAVFVSLA